MSDSDFHVRKNASKALLRIGGDAVPFLVPLFSHPDVRVRGLVLSILVSMGKGIVPILESSISGKDWMVSHRIVDTIWRLGGEKVEPTLVRLLSNKCVQKHVIILLGIMQSKLALPSLTKAFNEPKLRRVVVYALYRIGEKEAYPTIVTSLQSSSASVASLSEKIVCKVGRPMLPYLLSALKKKPAKKRLLLTVMGKIGVGPALPHLEKLAVADPEIGELIKQLNLRSASKQSGLLGGIFGKNR
jgi:HEAT repeat protein